MIALCKIRSPDCIINRLVICVLLTGLTATACAADQASALNFHAAGLPGPGAQPFMLAANESDVVKSNTNMPEAIPEKKFEPPLITKRKAHLYLGLSTIALAGLTALTAPEVCNGVSCPPRDVNGTHATLAKATIGMAVATIATGLYAHWDDFRLADGWSDPDNLHVLLGVTGAALMAYAVNKSANSSVPVSHAGIAEAGAIGMLIAIKLTW